MKLRLKKAELDDIIINRLRWCGRVLIKTKVNGGKGTYVCIDYEVYSVSVRWGPKIRWKKVSKNINAQCLKIKKIAVQCTAASFEQICHQMSKHKKKL